MSAVGGRGETMKSTRKKLIETPDIRYGVMMARVDPPQDPPQPPPQDPPQDPAIAAKYLADAARAESEKLAKELEKLKQQLPTEEQRAHWAQLEADKAKDDEDKLQKAGQFEQWREQINKRHQTEIDAERQQAANARALAEQIESELNEKLVGLEFAGAAEWFGIDGKTVLLPDIAQKYFAGNVSVDVVRDANGRVTSRTVIVRNNSGAVIVDPKTGKPASFSDAMGELINAHPSRSRLLRGSGKVGSGSAGGGNGADTVDITRLRASDFNDPAVRERVRQSQNTAGGLQIGPGFDRMRQKAGK
jgi:hypothetical protein